MEGVELHNGRGMGAHGSGESAPNRAPPSFFTDSTSASNSGAAQSGDQAGPYAIMIRMGYQVSLSVNRALEVSCVRSFEFVRAPPSFFTDTTNISAYASGVEEDQVPTYVIMIRMGYQVRASDKRLSA